MASSIFGSGFGNATWDGSTLTVSGILAATAIALGTNPAQSGMVRRPQSTVPRLVPTRMAHNRILRCAHPTPYRLPLAGEGHA